MKKNFGFVALVLAWVTAGQWAQAEAITLEQLDGTVYAEVKVTRVQPSTIAFTHSGGVAKIPSGSLTDESLAKLGLDPADNPEFKDQREDIALKENLRMLKKNRLTIPGGVGTGQTIKTKDITDINPINILVTENGVPRRVELVTLPKEIQQEIGYDSAKAEAYTKAKSQAEYSASVDAAKVKADQDKKDAADAKLKAEADKKAAAAAAAKAKATPVADPKAKFNAMPATK